MSNLVLDESKIDSLNSSYEAAERIIIDGSDEHLDIILTVQKHLTRATYSTCEVVKEIENNFNHFTPAIAKRVIVKLFPAFRTAYQIIGILKRNHAIYKGVKSHVSAFESELNELKEFISDLSRYKVEQNEELVALFNEEM